MDRSLLIPQKPQLLSAHGTPISTEPAMVPPTPTAADVERMMRAQALMQAVIEQRGFILECFARAFLAETGATHPSQVKLLERRTKDSIEWRFELKEGVEVGAATRRGARVSDDRRRGGRAVSPQNEALSMEPEDDLKDAAKALKTLRSIAAAGNVEVEAVNERGLRYEPLAKPKKVRRGRFAPRP